MVSRRLPIWSLIFGAAVSADLLLWDAPLGLGAAVFASALLTFLLTQTRDRRPCLIPALASTIAIFALVVQPGALALCLVSIGLMTTSAAARGWLPSQAPDAALSLIRGLAALPPIRALRYARHRGTPPGTGRHLMRWLLPIGITGGFAILLGIANPVIGELGTWIAERCENLATPQPRRVLLWWLAGFGVLALRYWRGQRLEMHQSQSTRDNRGFVVRTLVLCNLLFGWQLLLDLRYLALGAALPEGMSYAAYAHRGAYPLLITALLAAVFVLLCVRPNGLAQRSRLVRTCVYLWLGQNMVLAGFAIWRLCLYVAAYGLTHWRLAAAIWMALVVCGLGLIIARIVWSKSNHWLCNVNAALCLSVLLLCTLFDRAGGIASWNVSHRAQLAAGGVAIDIYYLQELGPATLPALRRLHAEVPSADSARAIEHLEHLVDDHLADWRGWTWRQWRVQGR
ncbi:MAG: DUF4173 domain-containing protein [Planctomycetota bacterium]|nr:DUF4173 domain-containing protein [Planctomycetota bacterium]